MSQSGTKVDSTKIKETVRLKCSKAICKKILKAGIFVFLLTGLIVATVCLVLLVGNKSPDKEGKRALNISLCASYKLSTVVTLIYKLRYERRIEKNKMLHSASSADLMRVLSVL